MTSLEHSRLLEAPTLAALVDARAAATPDAPMLFDEHDRCVTFAEYSSQVTAMAENLQYAGIGPGHVVAWQLPTRIETVILLGALARLGATQVPMLPMHRERELAFMLGQTRARVFCVPGQWRGVDYVSLAGRVRDLLGESFDVLRCTPWPAIPAGRRSAAELIAAPVDGDAVRWIFYSSGTTADPKGVMHSDRAAMASGRGLAASQGFRPTDRYGVAFPFTHIGGLTNVCAVLAAGYSLILVEAFDPARTTEIFARSGATVVGGGPAFYRAFLEVQRHQPGRPILPGLRFMTGGGAPMPPAMHLEVREQIGGLGCAHGYGMTETCSIVAMNDPADTDDHLCHTVGRVVPGMELQVVTGTGEVAPTSVEGEIRVRGDFLFKGYLDTSLDAEAFDAEGWYRTGDLGSLDESGYVRITGRSKDVIIRKGENLSAKEIEDVVYSHPDIADVAVVGLPDEERGELVCAVIVLEPGVTEMDVASLASYLDTRGLMRQKYPERVVVLDALPRNAAGKVAKSEISRLLTGRI